MRLINKVIRCSQCGCIFLPDAITCPKCGKACHHKRNEIHSMLMFNGINYLSGIEQTGNDKDLLAV